MMYRNFSKMLNADSIQNFNCVMHLNGIIATIRAQLFERRQVPSGVELLILGTEPYTRPQSERTASEGNLQSTGQELGCPSVLPGWLAPTYSPLYELVTKLPRVSKLFKHAAEVFQTNCVYFAVQLNALKIEATQARLDLFAWSSIQSSHLQPSTVARFTQPYRVLLPDSQPLLCQTLRADSYIDRT